MAQCEVCGNKYDNRIFVAVVTGTSFLGAGTMIRGESGVEGLTTAASLLFSAVIGMGVALSQYVLAVGLHCW